MSAQEQQYHVASDEQVVEDLDPENEGYLAPSKCGMFRATQPVVLATCMVEYVLNMCVALAFSPLNYF